MRDLYVEAPINLEALAQGLAELPGEELVEFILEVDGYAADTSFTIELIERLQKVLDEEGTYL